LIEKPDSGTINEGNHIIKRRDIQYKSYYDMTDPNFRNLMIGVVQNLEPLHMKKGVIILNELDEVGEIMFVCDGSIGVGYELNKFKKVVLRFNNRCVIGAFYATFNQRSNFIYCSTSDIESHFIRRHAWLQLLEDVPLIAYGMKKRILEHYYLRLKFRLSRRKGGDLRRYLDRKDY